MTSNPAQPRSAPGYVVEALARRRAAGVAPFTVLTCDNLPSNGRTVHGVLSRLAEIRGGDLGRYIAAEVACPSTMLDRIVPATTAEDRAEVAAVIGLEDAWPVIAEPYSLWVVEDRFPPGRPSLSREIELVGRRALGADELRLLNGSHSDAGYSLYRRYATIADHDAPDFGGPRARSWTHKSRRPSWFRRRRLASYQRSRQAASQSGDQAAHLRVARTDRKNCRSGCSHRARAAAAVHDPTYRARGRGLDALRHRRDENGQNIDVPTVRRRLRQSPTMPGGCGGSPRLCCR